MSEVRVSPSPETTRAETHPEHPDPALRGRTYSIPFAAVWKAAVALASGDLRGWAGREVDEDRGIIWAESLGLFGRLADDLEIRINLDENGQTRVDAWSEPRDRGWLVGRSARELQRFFRALDRRVDARPGNVVDATRSLPRSMTFLLLFLLLGACSSREQPAPEEAASPQEVQAPERNFLDRNYERDVVFFAARGDSALLVPWFFSAHSRTDGVDRELRGWLARGGGWDPFFQEIWETPPSRAAWRILPRGPVRLIVGPGGALKEILFQDGGRNLEVIPGDLLVEWSGPRAQGYRVQQGVAVLSDGQVNGLVVDMNRAWTPRDPAPGDWGFLISGDSLQMVMEDQSPATATAGGSFSCWARMEFLDRQWQDVRLVPSDLRSFEAARTDVPVAWTIESPGQEVGGRLQVVDSYLEAGEGEGPILPVSGLFQLSGNLILNGRTFPVLGFMRHKQG